MSGAEFTSFEEMYLSTYADFEVSATRAGTVPLSFLESAQESHETIDRGTTDNSICFILESDLKHCDVDYGNGRKNLIGGHASVNLVPAATDALWRVDGPHRLLNLSFPKAQSDALFSEYDVPDDPFVAHAGTEFILPQLTRLAENLWRTAQNSKTPTLLIDGMFQALLGQLLSDVNSGPVRSRHRVGALSDDDVRRVLELINGGIDLDLKVEDLAREVDLSPFHFSRAFQKRTGQAPYQYLLERRIARARDLLEHSKDPIAEIAYACGFSSQSHMTTTFSKQLGITPAKYRKERRE